MQLFKKLIDEQGITPKTVLDLIEAHAKDHERMKKLYQRYKADSDGPEIFNREPVVYEEFETGGNLRRLDDKVNNRLNNAFDADIVDTKVGYLFGHPISYNVDEENPTLKSEIETFILRNNAEDIDSEYGKIASICGQGARLAYVDTDGNERIKNINPWEVVFIGDDIHEPDYSLRYYPIGEVNYAEFYDGLNIHFFKQEKGTDYVPVNEESKPHMFEYNPLFGLANNLELKGDAEKVLALVDAYDRIISDATNEIEQHRLAYMLLKGMGVDEDTLKELKKTGIIELMDKDDSVSYLTKDINDQIIENTLNRIDDNIMRFAKSVNFSDEAFGGQISGVAIRFKLLSLENKCITMERKFISSLRYQFKVLFSAWAKRKSVSKDDYLKVWYGFKRNIPVDVLGEASTTVQLKGQVSERTRLSLLPFVDDVEYELEEMQKDALLYGNELEPLTDGEDNEPT